MLRLIVGAPIANRAWALPGWFECLARQTRRPDGLVFVHSGRPGDDTWQAIFREAARHGFHSVRIEHDPRPPHPRHDSARFETLASLRNRLLELVAGYRADLFLSLDTDVMLEDPRTIEHLQELVCDQGFDVASPVAFLHPLASHPENASKPCWAYNAGWWAPGGVLNDPQRPWHRPAPESITWGDAIEIQVPMAVWLGNRRAIRCRYRPHESGEDLGFAQDLDSEGLRVIWDTSLRTRHIWSEADLLEQAAAA